MIKRDNDEDVANVKESEDEKYSRDQTDKVSKTYFILFLVPAYTLFITTNWFYFVML